jgi:hypothetical protein
MDRVVRADARPTRSALERITRKTTNTWSIDAYLLPSGAAGTAPDMGAFFRAALGQQTITGGVSVAYTLLSTQTWTGSSLSLYRQYSALLGEALAGAYVDELKISAKGGDEPRVAFSGGSKSHYHASKTSLHANAAGGANAISVDFPDNIDIGAIVSIGGDTNGGAGYAITSKAAPGGTGTFTNLGISPVLGGNVNTPASILPFAPSDSTAGPVVSGNLGSFQIGDFGGTLLSVPILDYELTLKNNFKPVNDQAFQAEIEDVQPGYREISGKVTLRARQDLLAYLGTRKRFAPQNLTAIFGNVAGSICSIVARAELMFGDGAAIPQEDEGTVDLTFACVGSAGNDELTVTFT